MKQRLAIVLNPNSGKSETSQSEIKKLFPDQKASVQFFDITKGVDKLTKLIAAYKPQAVVAVGGDGTVNAVAGIVVTLKLPMGVVPAGTLNHFSKDMNIPSDPAEAAAIILKNKPTKIDYATSNDRVFVNNCNLGGYPEVVIKRDELSKLPSKWLAAAVAAIQVKRRHTKQEFELDIDGKTVHVRAGSLFIGNNPYALEGINLTSRERLDTGRLQLVVIKTGRLRHLIGILIGFVTKRIHEKVDVYDAQQIQINSARKQYNVAIDGEVATFDMPLHIKIHPKALNVLV